MMRSAPIGVTVSLVLAASVGFAPAAALAGGFHGRAAGSRVSVGARPLASHPSVSHSILSHPAGPHRAFGSSQAFGPHQAFGHGFVTRPVFRPIAPFAVFASPVVVYAPPAVYDAPTAYDDPSASYAPASAVYIPPPGSTVSVASAPPPTPTVVVFPTGRYELRGDGMTTPYTWVWIPNPPTGPPVTSPMNDSVSEKPAPTRSSRLYRWTDDQGVVHVTDNREAVPQSLRATQTPTP